MADDFLFLGLENDVNKGQITQIYVKNGDAIQKGQNLFELEADKLSQPIIADHDGRINQINFKVGDIIKKGAVFATNSNRVTSTTPSAPMEQSESGEIKSVREPVRAPSVAPIQNQNSGPIQSNSKQEGQSLVLATPLARRIAHEMALDIKVIPGTGPNGRVLKADLINYNLNSKNSKNAPPKNGTATDNELIKKEKMTATRKAIAKAMTTSKAVIPHTTLMMTVNVTALVQLRSQLKKTIVKPDFKLTYMPFFIKAVVKGLKAFPIMNAMLDLKNFEIIYHNYYHVGIAVDTPQGLIVPLIKVTEEQDIFSLTTTYNELIMKVQNKKLTAADMKSGTFTITNYGSLGLDFGTPIINYPQAAILGIGAIRKTPVVDENNNIVVNDLVPFSISIDHRIIDGADAGRFMAYLKKILESPTSLLISV